MENQAGDAATHNQVVFGSRAFKGAVSSYVLMGVSVSMLGPLLDTFASKFHVGLGEVGIVLSLFAVGGLAGNIASWWGLNVAHGRLVVQASVLTIAVGCIGIALSPTWLALLCSVTLYGAGFSAMNIGLNTLMTRTALDVRGHQLSVGNASYGVGAVIGPVLIALLTTHRYVLAYLLVLPLALVALLLIRPLHALPLKGLDATKRVVLDPAHRKPILLTFIAIFNCYLLLESSTSGWLATVVHHDGHSSSFASLITGGFWGGLGLGRYLTGKMHPRISAAQILLTGVALCIVVAPLALLSALAPYVFPLVGFIISSTFTMGLVWYSELVPHDSNGISAIILCMVPGTTLGPWMTGQLVAHFGVHAVPVTIAAEALLLLVVASTALRFRPAIVNEPLESPSL